MTQAFVRCRPGTSCLITPDLRRHTHAFGQCPSQRISAGILPFIALPPPFRRLSCAELPCSRIRSIILVPIRHFHLGFRSAVRGELCCFLLYSYTRDITASADDIAGGTRVEMAYPTMSGLKFLFHHARHTTPLSPFSWNANTRRLLITNATPP